MTKNNILSTNLIFNAVQDAISKKKDTAASIFENPENSRKYKCCVENCSRNAYAKNYCNAHYLRHRAGKSLDVAVRARKREDACSVCNEKTGAKGGWGMCPKHYKTARQKAIKECLVAFFGGKCKKCLGVFPTEVYDFHHLEQKDESPSHAIASLSVEKIAAEIGKCTLLCANCHRIEHAREF